MYIFFFKELDIHLYNVISVHYIVVFCFSIFNLSSDLILPN